MIGQSPNACAFCASMLKAGKCSASPTYPPASASSAAIVAKWKLLLIGSQAERKCCASRADVKHFTCPVLAVMPTGADFRPIAEPLCRWCSIPGIGACCATLLPPSLSVTMTRGTRRCRFSSLQSKRLAALLSRRLWTAHRAPRSVGRVPEPRHCPGDLDDRSRHVSGRAVTPPATPTPNPKAGLQPS
jgi:hypothetical protein